MNLICSSDIIFGSSKQQYKALFAIEKAQSISSLRTSASNCYYGKYGIFLIETSSMFTDTDSTYTLISNENGGIYSFTGFTLSNDPVSQVNI